MNIYKIRGERRSQS